MSLFLSLSQIPPVVLSATRHSFQEDPMYVLKSSQGDYVTRIDHIGAAFGGYSIFFSSQLS
jgi:hypothetical protein